MGEHRHLFKVEFQSFPMNRSDNLRRHPGVRQQRAMQLPGTPFPAFEFVGDSFAGDNQ
jgi:hypothetical protein